MTDQQDEICDRLVAAKLGPNWMGGLFHVAALVIDPDFVPNPRADGRPRQFARAVGWPLPFCEAVIGVNSSLRDEDERRSLAITLFSQIPLVDPGRRRKGVRGARARQQNAMISLTIRAHRSACGADCPLVLGVVERLKQMEIARVWRPLFRDGVDCQSEPGMYYQMVRRNSTATHHAAVSMRYLSAAMEYPSAQHALCDALRESAKAETKSRGLDAAIRFCLDMAEMLDIYHPPQTDRNASAPAETA